MTRAAPEPRTSETVDLTRAEGATMSKLTIPCPHCTDGFTTAGDRHARTRQDVCQHCAGTGYAPAETGLRAETSAPPAALARPVAEEPGDAVEGEGQPKWDDATRIAINTDAERRIALIEQSQPFEISKHLSTVCAHTLGIYDLTDNLAILELAVALKACAVDAVETALTTTTGSGGRVDKLRKALERTAFCIDGIGAAATPTPELLRQAADHLDRIKCFENVAGYARSFRARADFISLHAAEARAVLAALVDEEAGRG